MIETGVDIVEIDRIADLAARYGERFARRVFSPQEWQDCAGRADSLAARFAAKEATIKALGSSDMALHEISVVRHDGQRPTIELSGRARAYAESIGVHHIAVSLSHARTHAVAVVIVEVHGSAAKRP